MWAVLFIVNTPLYLPLRDWFVHATCFSLPLRSGVRKIGRPRVRAALKGLRRSAKKQLPGMNRLPATREAGGVFFGSQAGAVQVRLVHHHLGDLLLGRPNLAERVLHRLGRDSGRPGGGGGGRSRGREGFWGGPGRGGKDQAAALSRVKPTVEVADQCGMGDS